MERDVANATKIFTIIIRAAYLSKIFCPTEPRLLIVVYQCDMEVCGRAATGGCIYRLRARMDEQ